MLGDVGALSRVGQGFVFMRMKFGLRAMVEKKPAVSSDIAGWNNIRARHACISNGGRQKRLGRPFQYSPSEAPDVDARLAGSERAGRRN